LRDVGIGPELGACADQPDRAFTFGEAGIGTCLSGPTDLQFVELDGKTWLAVANADPYLNFASGSVLMIDWDSVDTSARQATMDSLTASSIATDRFVGGIGVVTDRPDGVPLLLVPSRFSPDATTTSARDQVLVIDISDPAAPTWFEGGDRVTVEDDPYHVAIVGGRAFVLNLTDHSLSVLDTHSTPIEVIDIAGAPTVGPATFIDTDASGSSGGIASTQIVSPQFLLDDTWTLSWVDTTWRVWAPTAGNLQRWKIGDGTVVEAPTGPDVESGVFAGPLSGPFAFRSIDDLPMLAFASGGDIFTATNTGSVSAWIVDTTPLLRSNPVGGFDALLDSPTLFNSESGVAIAFEAISNDDGLSRIALAFSDDGLTFDRAEAPALEGGPGVSLGDPFVRGDTLSGSLRMWLSVDDGTEWSIGHSESGGGSAWSEPSLVTGLPQNSAAPAVAWVDGRYHLWFSLWDGTQWSLARAWSYDGLTWLDAEAVQPLSDATDITSPPRPALQAISGGGFAVSGRDAGELSGLAADGAVFTSALGVAGFSFRVVTGFDLTGREVDAELGVNGLEPASAATIDGDTHLFVTLVGADGQRRVGQVRADDDGWTTISADLFASDELVQSFEPAVHGVDGAWSLWFATPSSTGTTVVRRATSSDGLSWAVQDGVAFAPDVPWARRGVRPGSVQELSDGRLRLWFTADDGDRVRIGSALSDDGGESFTVEPGAGDDEWQLGIGLPGTFDDSSVADPRIFQFDGQVYLSYAGFDGQIWRIGIATLGGDVDAPGPWVRRVDPAGARSPWLSTIGSSFASAGVTQPVPVLRDDGQLDVWFAGQDRTDIAVSRLGRAIGSPAALFPAIAFPTFGDTLRFRTLGGSEGTSSIELAQVVDAFTTNGQGGSNLRYDEERGFLYVTSKLANHIYVVDVRDDGDREGQDANVLDLEGLIRVRTLNGATAFRDLVPLAGTDRLYGTTRRPDGIAVIDASEVLDDSVKQVHENAAIGALPLRSTSYDAGADSFNNPGLATGAGIAIRDRGGRRHLFVTHFRDNSVTVFDLDRGTFGEEVAYLPFIGENPHVVRISPDGRFAVVANFLGEVDEGLVSSTLTVIDADPDSPTFATVLTTLVNR
jgi:DNA-binding beta-propeller fold protein YncE